MKKSEERLGKNNTIVGIKGKNTVLYEKLLFITTRWHRKITNGLIQLSGSQTCPGVPPARGLRVFLSPAPARFYSAPTRSRYTGAGHIIRISSKS